jgi:hypothetical protein
LNLYSYVNNDPLNEIDPLGTSSCSDFSNSIVDAITNSGTTVTSATAFFVILNNYLSHNKLTQHDGFRPELTQGGQGGEIWAHLYGHIGTNLTGPMGDNFNIGPGRSDDELIKDIQELQREMKKKKAGQGNNADEKCAEVADDVAGRAVADVLKQVADGTLPPDVAKREIADILCK